MGLRDVDPPGVDELLRYAWTRDLQSGVAANRLSNQALVPEVFNEAASRREGSRHEDAGPWSPRRRLHAVRVSKDRPAGVLAARF